MRASTALQSYAVWSMPPDWMQNTKSVRSDNAAILTNEEIRSRCVNHVDIVRTTLRTLQQFVIVKVFVITEFMLHFLDPG